MTNTETNRLNYYLVNMLQGVMPNPLVVALPRDYEARDEFLRSWFQKNYRKEDGYHLLIVSPDTEVAPVVVGFKHEDWERWDIIDEEA